MTYSKRKQRRKNIEGALICTGLIIVNVLILLIAINMP
jgi:hypothetical protein